MPEQFGVEGSDHMGGPTDAFALVDEALPYHVDEIDDVAVDRTVGACRVIRRFRIRGDIATGDPGGLETCCVVIGVEIAVGSVPGITRFRRPHAVADL